MGDALDRVPHRPRNLVAERRNQEKQQQAATAAAAWPGARCCASRERWRGARGVALYLGNSLAARIYSASG